MFKKYSVFPRWLFCSLFYFFVFLLIDFISHNSVSMPDLLKISCGALITGFLWAFLDREKAPWKKEAPSSETNR